MFKNLTCQICNSNQIKVIGKPRINKTSAKFIRLEYSVVQCLQCSFYFVDPLIDFTIEEWRTLYGNEYFGDMTRWHKQERLTSISHRLNMLEEECENRITNFLDVGCGEGYVLIESINRHWNTFGFDISDNRISEARNSDIDFRLGDLFAVKYPDNFFDAAYMDSVLEHLLNPLAYLKELNRVIKKGGTLYVGVPNEDSLFNDFRRFINLIMNKKEISIKLRPFEAPYHVVGFNRNSIKKISKESNFQINKLVNFAAKYEYKKYKTFSSAYFIHLTFLPVDLAAAAIKKETYYEAVLKK
jgi:ubiquinone/menaquinone biosynthesis C-methylase UbiE